MALNLTLTNTKIDVLHLPLGEVDDIHFFAHCYTFMVGKTRYINIIKFLIGKHYKCVHNK